jgi:hypothetical protein
LIDANADGLVHIFLDSVADDEFAKTAKDKGAFIVATLTVVASESRAGEGQRLASDSRIRPFLAPGQVDSLSSTFPMIDASAPYLTNALQSIRKLHAAGVPILAGTDAGNPGTAHGASIHGELELLVRAGLTPTEALASATSLPAKYFNLPDRGRIAPGFRADLILVDGDPTTDITATRAITRVWKNGYAIERALASAKAEASVKLSGSEPSLVSDFDNNSASSSFGAGWQPTTDQMAGGASIVSHRVIDEGARGSHGALEITGEIKEGFGYPWAGMMFFPAKQPMQPADLSSHKELIFHARGDGRTYNVMVFSGESMQSMPSVQTFTAGPTWQEVRIPFANFPGANFSLVRGLTFSAGSPKGTFHCEVDQVELR